MAEPLGKERSRNVNKAKLPNLASEQLLARTAAAPQTFPMSTRRPAARSTAEAGTCLTKQKKAESASDGRSPIAGNVRGESAASAHLNPAKQPPLVERKVESWLKTNAAYQGFEDAELDLPPRSPSDSKRRKEEADRADLNLKGRDVKPPRVPGHLGTHHVYTVHNHIVCERARQTHEERLASDEIQHTGVRCRARRS